MISYADDRVIVCPQSQACFDLCELDGDQMKGEGGRWDLSSIVTAF